MRFDIVTIFPGFFDSPLSTGLLYKAREVGLISVHCHDLRNWTHDRHRTVDDAPFGGGAGMVMRPAPWFEALDELAGPDDPARVVLLAPDGARFDQRVAARLATEPRLVLCCGRYEGVDERVRSRVDEVVSLGDFVLAGGETAALAVVEAVARLLPGVLGNAASAADESFVTPGAEGGLGLLEYPQYTRPASYRGLDVPEVLRSGDHGAIARWRRAQAVERTRRFRPDLLAAIDLGGGLKSEAGTQETGRHAAPSGSPPVNRGSGGLKSEAGTQETGGPAAPSGSPQENTEAERGSGGAQPPQ